MAGHSASTGKTEKEKAQRNKAAQLEQAESPSKGPRRQMTRTASIGGGLGKLKRRKSCPNFQDDDILAEMQGHVLFKVTGEPPSQKKHGSDVQIRERSDTDERSKKAKKERRKSISRKWNAFVSKKSNGDQRQEEQEAPAVPKARGSPLQRGLSSLQLHATPLSMMTPKPEPVPKEGGPTAGGSKRKTGDSPKNGGVEKTKKKQSSRSSKKNERKRANVSKGLAVVKRTRSKSADSARPLEELRQAVVAQLQLLYEELQLLLTVLEGVPVAVITAMLIRMEGNVYGVARFLVDRGWGKGGRGMRLLEEFRFTNKFNAHFTTRYFHGLYTEHCLEKLRRAQPRSYLTYYRPCVSDRQMLNALMEQMICSKSSAELTTVDPPRFDRVSYVLHYKDADGDLGFMTISGPSVHEHKDIIAALDLRYPIAKGFRADLVPTILPGLSHWIASMRGTSATTADAQ
mmetsp:Transcript_14849/g.58244  ORF Transcript_14849/g.58244 Transcript_14849/m.58244 type:complete len:458 (-) Transcript_14849:24-1397(-)